MTESQQNRINLLKSYLEDDAQDPFLHFALAKEFEKLGDGERALEKYLFLLTEHSDYVGTYYHLGKLYEKIAEPGKAQATYEEGIEVALAQKDNHSASELQGALDLLTA